MKNNGTDTLNGLLWKIDDKLHASLNGYRKGSENGYQRETSQLDMRLPERQEG